MEINLDQMGIFVEWLGNSIKWKGKMSCFIFFSNFGCKLLTMGTELKSEAKGQEQVNSFNSRQVEMCSNISTSGW